MSGYSTNIMHCWFIWLRMSAAPNPSVTSAALATPVASIHSFHYEVINMGIVIICNISDQSGKLSAGDGKK